MNTYKVRHIFWILIGGMICLISSCNNFSVSEKQAETFLKYYAVDIEHNTGTVVIQTSDGGYAILGNYENPSGQKDIFVIFTDEFGRQKSDDLIVIGTEGDDHGYSMIRLGDGYLISGTSHNATQKWGYLVNISSDGRILWERNYSGYQELEFRDAYLAPDGHIIITGYGKNDPGDREVIIFKTSAEGDSIWMRQTLLTGSNDVGEAIIEYQNRYHILTTSRNVTNTSQSHIRMLNTNTDGRGPTRLDIQEDYLSGKDIVKNASGRMFILGNIEDPVSRISEIYLAELVLTGDGGAITNLDNSEIIPYSESLHATSFAPVGEEGLAIGGWQSIQNDNDILFLLVDNDFQNPKPMTYGSKFHQASHSIIYTFDQGYALTGSVDLGGGRTSMLLKLDSDGQLR
jgi:hypothetical protein